MLPGEKYDGENNYLSNRFCVSLCDRALEEFSALLIFGLRAGSVIFARCSLSDSFKLADSGREYYLKLVDIFGYLWEHG